MLPVPFFNDGGCIKADEQSRNGNGSIDGDDYNEDDELKLSQRVMRSVEVKQQVNYSGNRRCTTTSSYSDLTENKRQMQ